MACHEIAALRLGLMRVLGRHDGAEGPPDRRGLAAGAPRRRPVRLLGGETGDLASLKRLFGLALAELNTRAATAAPGDPRVACYRALIVLTKEVELDLDDQIEGLTRLYRDLDQLQDGRDARLDRGSIVGSPS